MPNTVVQCGMKLISLPDEQEAKLSLGIADRTAKSTAKNYRGHVT